MSADGRIVAFTSNATNLVPGDTNELPDVFWHDRDTDNDGVFDEPGAIATVLATAWPDGGVGNGFSFDVGAQRKRIGYSRSTQRPWDLLAAPDVDTNDENDIYAVTFDLSTSQRTSTRDRESDTGLDRREQRVQPACERRLERQSHRIRDHGEQSASGGHEQHLGRRRQ